MRLTLKGWECVEFRVCLNKGTNYKGKFEPTSIEISIMGKKIKLHTGMLKLEFLKEFLIWLTDNIIYFGLRKSFLSHFGSF